MFEEKEICTSHLIHKRSGLLLMTFILAFFCFFPLKSYSQYYPALTPVSADQLPGLLKQLRSTPPGDTRIQVLNNLGNLYLSLPLRKPADLDISRRYEQQALHESIASNNQARKADALLLLGQLNFLTATPDSTERLLTIANDTTKAKLLLQLSFYSWYRTDGDDSYNNNKSIDFARRAGVISKKLGLTELTLMARRNIAIIHLNQAKPDAEAEMLKILKEYQLTGYKKLHYIYFALAYYSNNTSRNAKTYYYSQAAVNSVNSTHDNAAAGDIYMIKGMIDYAQERYNDAIRSCEQALGFYSRQAGMYDVSMPSLHSIISKAYDKMGKKLEAISYIENMMQKYPPNSMTDSITYLKRIGHAYRELKRFPEAESYFLQVSAILKKHHLNPGDTNLDLGSLYLDAHKYEKARTFLYEELAAPHANYSKGGQRQLHYMLFLADSATHHYLSAIKHQNFLNNQSEFKLRRERDSVVKTMEVAYKALEKEQEIKLKNQNIAQLKQQAIAQQEKLKQSQKISLLTGSALLLSLVVIILFGFLYRQNKRSSREMSHKNQLLYKLVSEKEWLLKEVHHRVKNNLHTVFCLLESQARTATTEARSALEKSQFRIYAMSLFHQKIYQSDNIEQVDFGFYIRDFLIFLQDSFDLEARNIRITQHIEPASLSLKQAMPLALVANEALTNAAKYAFEGRSSGEIRLMLEQQQQTYQLIISDDGIGIPANYLSVNRSLGMELMHGLCADIGATISFEIKNGTKIYINFAAEQVSKRPVEYQEI